MGIFYHFLSTLEGVNSSNPSPQISHPWLNPTWLPPANRELQLLEQSIIVQRSFLAGALKCAMHREIWILLRQSYKEYINRDAESTSEILSLWKPWSWPLAKWKDSILPFVTRHLATLWTMEFYRFLASLRCSKLVLLKLSQHPYYKLEYLALKDSSPLSVASRAFVVSVWSSTLYYLADLTVRQISIGLAQYDWSIAGIVMSPEAKEKYLASTWVKSSWECVYRQYLRLWYSSLGSAMGSMVWPGFGTLAGIGFGEEWADQQEIPSPPGPLLKAFPQLEKYFATAPATHTKPVQESTMLHATELLCDCCQRNYFSSNPTHPTHAPISSKSCEHTICRACVDLCQVAELKESGAYGVAFSEQLAACPICDTPAAFSPEDLLVNQSLCDVISLLERQRGNCRSSQQVAPIEVDALKVKKHKRLSWLASMSDDDNSPSQFPSSSEMSSDDEDNALVDDDDMGEGGVVDDDYAPSRVASSNSIADDENVVADDDNVVADDEVATIMMV